ncbi:MAG: aromatic ring-hydroxylating dioxygenase subunit alpha [Pseudomonadales bacterium]|nr:aromatic ring-hydroxylating dioxygenase subunit alpha [Pseudomonadales bacterium]
MTSSYDRQEQSALQDYQRIAMAPLEEAESLPFSAYRSQSAYELEAETVFRNEWVFVVAEQELPNCGDYFAITLAGEPIAVIRGQDNEIRALSNVCRHRGTPLLDEGFGKVEKHIVCPYHAWAYKDNGELKAAPLPGDINIDKDQHCLPTFFIESWHGLLFVNLSSNPEPLAKRLAGIDDYLGYFNLPSFENGFKSTTEYWNANWKLAMENAMESYHLFKVHKQTLETVTPTKQAYYIAGHSEWTLTGGKMLDTSSKLMKWFRGDYPEAYDHYVLISLPPSFVGILTYEGLSWIQVLPIDKDHSYIRSAGISSYSGKHENKTEQAFTEAFFAEDKDICERVHKGMYSTLAKGGKLVSMERILVDFHQFLGSRLFESNVSDFFQSPEAERFIGKNTDSSEGE